MKNKEMFWSVKNDKQIKKNKVEFLRAFVKTWIGNMKVRNVSVLQLNSSKQMFREEPQDLPLKQQPYTPETK